MIDSTVDASIKTEIIVPCRAVRVYADVVTESIWGLTAAADCSR